MTRISTRRTVVLSATMLAALCAGFLSASARSQGEPERLNRIVGTWAPVSIEAEVDGTKAYPYGHQPAGSLIFAENGRFSVVLNDPRLPRFASDNRAEATDAERIAAASGIALYGTYSVGEDGQFLSEIVEGSSFPNWNGITRGREQMTLNADGDTMVETFANLPAGPPLRMVWRRVD